MMKCELCKKEAPLNILGVCEKCHNRILKDFEGVNTIDDLIEKLLLDMVNETDELEEEEKKEFRTAIREVKKERRVTIDDEDLESIEKNLKKKEPMFNKDEVNAPNHYTHGTIETIDVINDWGLNFNLGNAVKYISRCNYKGNKEQDLRKAIKYLEFEIEKGDK